MIPYHAIAILLLLGSFGLYFRRQRSFRTTTRKMKTRNDDHVLDQDALTNLLMDLEADASTEGEDW